MSAIFVAYGERDRRTDVLEFAVDQAMSCGRELVVYHVQEVESESVGEIRAEIESVVQKKDPFLVYDIEIDRLEASSTEAGISKQELLLRAIFESDRDLDYVVMGEIKRGPIEDITHSSMTKPVLDEHSIPVMLVPL
jgi:nucleotide-binding universal stress UspA family protein